ncbi:MAG: beta-galactosidase [Anaerolineales bacterium]|nr:MAG: beta-galactosidase [Anaerolineales bacterium]
MHSNANNTWSSPFENVIESTLGGLIIYGLIVVLLVAIILLPPVSAAERILSYGYAKIPTQEGGFVSTDDGAQLMILPEGIQSKTRIKFTAIPRSSFLEGSAGNALLEAAENIPLWLIVKGPYYRIQFRGQEAPTKVVVRIPMPGDVDPLSTLDLYSWDGEAWDWLPHFVPPGDDFIEAQLDYLPQSIVVMQTKPLQPSVSADLALSADVPDQARDTVVEVNPQGLYLDADGAIRGDLGALPQPDQTTTYIVIPTLRNWEDDSAVRSDLIDNMLIDESARDEHIQRIVEAVVRNAYPGIDIDYRGINPDLRIEYTGFITELADALHEQGKQLSVRLELPVQIALDQWETGVYDWRAIGAVADTVKIPVPSDPRAYTPGGEMDTMLKWAVGEVNRYKLQLLVSTRSTERTNGNQKAVSYTEALAPFSQVSIEGDSTIVNPGQQVTFTLAGLQQSTGIQFDPASGTYWFAYVDPNGQQHTVWLENAASIARKLQYVAEYNLRGVAVQNLLGEENDGQIWEVIRKFLNLIIPPVESRFAVVWQVESAAGDVLAQGNTELTNPRYAWTAPEEGGEYIIAAAISSDGSTTGAARSSVSVLVATPTPIPTPTPLPTATPTPAPPTPTPAPTPTPEPAPPAAAPTAAPQPAVASAVGNLPFDYGIQVDPRGNKASNIGHIQALGFRWMKIQMPWKDVEPSPGNYQWGMWDDVIGAYSGAGIKILLSIPKAPDWARPAGDDRSVEGPPADYGAFARFLGEVAQRYQGRVQAIEVWNEQNLWYEGGGSPMPPEQYVAMLSAAYQSIKAADPNMIVVSGAPTPAGDVGGAAIDDITYLNAMYAAGLKNVSDAIGAHPSGYNCPATGDWQTVTDPAAGFRGPFDNRHHSWCFRGTMEGYRNVMVANGDSAKTIWPTEFGWAVSSNPQAGYEYARDNTQQEQAQWIVEAYQQAKSWGWVGTAFLWNLDYGVTAAGTELANFALLTPAGPVPAYSALAGMPK